MKKLLSVLLSLIILLSMTGITAFAAAPEKGIAFSKPSDVTVKIGDPYRNTAVTTPAGGRVIYTSSDPKIASVDSSGRVLCVQAGTVTITATSGSLSTSYKLTVTGSGILQSDNVKIISAQTSVRVGRSILLDVWVYPANYKYDSVEWYTKDYDILEVDEFGEVTGKKTGTAIVGAYVYAEGPRGQTEIGCAEIEIEVKKAAATGYTFDENKYDPDKWQWRSSVSADTLADVAVDTVELKDDHVMVPTKTVNEAVKNALNPGTTTSTVFQNYTSVSTVSLESAAAEMELGGGMVLLNFDTYYGRTPQGRLTINPRAYKPVKYDDPLQVGHSINVTLNVNDDAVSKVRDKFKKVFKNEILVVKSGQQGGYGMYVTGMVKTNGAFSKAKQSNLRLYTYDPNEGSGGTYRLVKNANLSIDNNKNLNFTTDTGNYLIISNGVLEKKSA